VTWLALTSAAGASSPGSGRDGSIAASEEKRRAKVVGQRHGDVAYIAKGMANIAKETGLSREHLYRSFSEIGNPTLKSTLAVMKALGIELTAKVPDAA
jgi:probable addiction module antidote protein